MSFSKDIQPILEQNCLNCHGQSMQSSRLDLSTREGALRGGTRWPAIVPGRADDSYLYRLAAGLDKPAMPLGGNKLTDAQIAAIKNWIDQGAHWDADVVAAKTRRSSRSRIWKRSNSLLAPAITGLSSRRSRRRFPPLRERSRIPSTAFWKRPVRKKV